MGAFVWPVSMANKITSAFGPRKAPTTGATTNHKGVDIAARIGTPVAAAFTGTVITADYDSGRGNYIVIDDGAGTTALYQHLNDFFVNVGETVGAGQKIASTGNSGLSTGAHLHFEVMSNGKHVNPIDFMSTYTAPGSGVSVSWLDDVGAYVGGMIDQYNVMDYLKKYWLWVIGGLVVVGIVKK